MQYRWTIKVHGNAKVRMDFLEEVPLKWYKCKQADMRERVPLYHLHEKEGTLEIKEETPSPKQAAQRKLWQFMGRMRALESQQIQLAKELRNEFPYMFKNYSIMAVLGRFNADTNSIDMGLMLKKYYPHLYDSDSSKSI